MVEQRLPSRAGQYSWVDRVTLAVCSGSKSDTARKTFSYQCRERPLRADSVAKVVLPKMSKILRAAGAVFV